MGIMILRWSQCADLVIFPMICQKWASIHIFFFHQHAASGSDGEQSVLLTLLYLFTFVKIEAATRLMVDVDQ